MGNKDRMWFRENEDGTLTRMKNDEPMKEDGTRLMAERDL